MDRARYAGPVGWVDANGDGEWAISLRCAELTGERATLFAGAGIVADSDPESEYEETLVKARAYFETLATNTHPRRPTAYSARQSVYVPAPVSA